MYYNVIGDDDDDDDDDDDEDDDDDDDDGFVYPMPLSYHHCRIMSPSPFRFCYTSGNHSNVIHTFAT